MDFARSASIDGVQTPGIKVVHKLASNTVNTCDSTDKTPRLAPQKKYTAAESGAPITQKKRCTGV